MSLVRLTLAGCVTLPLFGQANPDAFAGRMLAQASRVQWSAAYAQKAGCQKWIFSQSLQAPDLWSFHCADRSNGLIQESFYYLFGEPARPALLRIDLRPEDESPQWTAQLQRALETKLTGQFGAFNREPEIFEIGFHRARYGEPVAGQHWHTGDFDYFLHSNLNAVAPMGVRKGVELIIFQRRLMEERAKDDFIHQVDTLGFRTPPEVPKTESARNSLAQETSKEVIATLRRPNNSASREEEASLLLSANALVDRLTGLFSDEAAGSIRRQLAAFGVTLGGQTHDAGLSYHQDLLWRVWREFPDTGAGEQAFLELQQIGWSTATNGIGCPANPDLFREVIERGEAFLNRHAATNFRKEILFTLAVANESWWSVALAPQDDEIVYAPLYPRRLTNQQRAGQARERAIRYYRELIAIAPDSPEAASARRRLPRIESGLDTGQRRFFCFFD